MTSPRTAQPSEPVARIMTTSVATIDASATWADAVSELAANGIGAVLLVDDNERVGLVSERDLIDALAEGTTDLAARQIGEIATFDLIWADPDDTIAQAGVTMMDAEIRHLPVGDGREVLGIVSARDVLRVLVAAQCGVAVPA
ncbi:cyclic nucleotide-binding/CBS domain-containing protein [Nakamurella sp.]|uniref:cyclic nucleotide-binding/CBS domain-containing protein n=1 Tax=Nakamurella sp. TaxID=1869182 RepID=UPI0037844648